MTTSLPVSVVVPTIGRRTMLARCLRSILACDPRPKEIIVVDQSRLLSGARLPGTGESDLVKIVDCLGTGIARGTNAGLRMAKSDCVLVTHDDCTVDRDWIAFAYAARRSRPYLVTGRVLAPAGATVPSVKHDPAPHDFTGTLCWDVLYPNNMVVSRRAALELGGFDERPTLAHAAEDLDFCFRWSSAGMDLRYEPRMVVFHHPWRTPKELESTYKAYALGAGAFFAKHIHNRDLRLATPLFHLLRQGLKSRGKGIITGSRDDPARANVFLPVGFLRGWREVAQEFHQ